MAYPLLIESTGSMINVMRMRKMLIYCVKLDHALYLINYGITIIYKNLRKIFLGQLALRFDTLFKLLLFLLSPTWLVTSLVTCIKHIALVWPCTIISVHG